MSNTQQPEALRLAHLLALDKWPDAAAELRRQYARILELETKLDATQAAWLKPVRELLGHISDVLPNNAFDKIDTTTWNAVSRLVGVASVAKFSDKRSEEMSTAHQPEALRLAEQLRDMCSQFDTPSHERGVVNGAIQELRSLHARIAKLEAQLSSTIEESKEMHEALIDCVNLLVKTPKITRNLYVGKDRKSWGMQAKAVLDTAVSALSANGVETLQKPVEDGWLQEGPLLYRLTDERRPTNRDEILVTMANSSRTEEARTRRASELLDAIRAAVEDGKAMQ